MHAPLATPQPRLTRKHTHAHWGLRLSPGCLQTHMCACPPNPRKHSTRHEEAQETLLGAPLRASFLFSKRPGTAEGMFWTDPAPPPSLGSACPIQAHRPFIASMPSADPVPQRSQVPDDKPKTQRGAATIPRSHRKEEVVLGVQTLNPYPTSPGAPCLGLRAHRRGKGKGSLLPWTVVLFSGSRGHPHPAPGSPAL